jgi:hypothetical protein
MNGEVLNDAIYLRNLIIMEEYNLEFVTINAVSRIRTLLGRTIQAGLDEYDAVVPLLNHANTFAADGFAINIYDTALSVDAPWWDQNILESTSVGGAAYFIAGDIFIRHYDGLPMLMFNKKLLADRGMPSPYNYVRENNWTLDNFSRMVRGIYVDLDQDGRKNRYDLYGLATQGDDFISFVNGAGHLFMDKDGSDMPVFVGYSERMVSILDKILEYYASDDTYCIHRDAAREGGWGAAVPSVAWVFPEGRSLFFWGMTRYIELYLRDMEDDFGIVPIPKWDSNQDRYYSTVNGWNSFTYMLPRTVTDVNRNSIILDAMAYHGRKLILPAYYEVCLQRKYTRDEESGAMLDIIFNSAHYEPGGAGSFIGALFDAMQTGTVNLASIYERFSGRIEQDIQNLIESYESNR